MITLTIIVPNGAQIVAAGYVSAQVNKSSSGTAAGPFIALTPLISLDQTGVTTSYSFTDVNGGYGDWYAVTYVQADGVTASALGKAEPGYLSDLCGSVRDLLGVTTNEVSDTQIQGVAYLPAALARIRARLLSDAGLVFDTLVASGGDAAAHALAALAHLTAALLCPRMTVMVVDSEQLKDYRYQRNRQMDWNATQQELLSQYELFISQAAGESAATTLALMTGVALAGPTRAGYDTSGGLVTVNQGVMNEAGTPPLPNNLPLPGQGIVV